MKKRLTNNNSENRNVNTRLNSKNLVAINWPKVCFFDYLSVPRVLQEIIIQIKLGYKTTSQLSGSTKYKFKKIVNQ